MSDSKMRLNTLKPAPGRIKVSKRIGRGIGSGKGKTGGRGHKGQKARKSGNVGAAFEGGQMPMQKRLPKYGFNSHMALATAQLRLGELSKVEGDTVDMDSLRAANLIGNATERARVFLSGTISRAVILKGVAVTKGARAAIEAAGGRVED